MSKPGAQPKTHCVKCGKKLLPFGVRKKAHGAKCPPCYNIDKRERAKKWSRSGKGLPKLADEELPERVRIAREKKAARCGGSILADLDAAFAQKDRKDNPRTG